jgi:hypothetical protein
VSKVLTRDEIAGAQDLGLERVHMPEWGGDVLVRGMTGAERDTFLAGVIDGKGGVILQNLTAKLITATLVDETGNRLFTEAEVQTLAGKSAAALTRIFGVASRLSGISRDDVEGLEKNSEGGRSDGSGSG